VWRRICRASFALWKHVRCLRVERWLG